MGLFREGDEVIVTPGVDGIPFRGNSVPALKDKEYQNLQERMDAKVRIFDLSKAADLSEYQSIIDAVAKGATVISREEMQWDEKISSWRVLLRYCNLYMEPGNFQDGRAEYANGQIRYGPKNASGNAAKSFSRSGAA